jgi:ribosomal protein S18 acetylase RimI-like enzyme
MAKKEQHQGAITYRAATPADAQIASRLIFDTFPSMATYIFGLGVERRAVKILSRIFVLEDHRFSYKLTEMVLRDETVVGMFIAYPAEELPRLDRGLLSVIIRQHKFTDKLKVLLRGLPTVFIKEAAPDDFLLSNIAIQKGLRGQGIGAQVLGYVEEKAKAAGYHRLALIVEIDKKDACRFYEAQGFEVKAKHLEPPHRVKHLGTGFQQMVKVLDGS